MQVYGFAYLFAAYILVLLAGFSIGVGLAVDGALQHSLMRVVIGLSMVGAVLYLIR